MKTQLIRNKLSNFTNFLKSFYYRIQKFVKTGTGKNIGFPEHCALVNGEKKILVTILGFARTFWLWLKKNTYRLRPHCVQPGMMPCSLKVCLCMFGAVNHAENNTRSSIHCIVRFVYVSKRLNGGFAEVCRDVCLL